ncbi:hypothetical protein M0805_000538, partial [Coniferiporia weirii]
MSTAGSASSTPHSTPSRARTIPRPPPSPNRPATPRATSPVPSAASASTLSAAANTPRPLGPGAAGSGSHAQAGSAGASQGAPGTPPPESPSARSSKGRARDLLRKHYGLGVGPPPPLSGPGKPLDPMDIDSPAFDAKSYYEQLITTSSLSTLMKKENELLSEIRHLDSERQSLVYNHHHE